MMMDNTVSSSREEEGLPVVQSEVWDPIEEVRFVSRANMVPSVEVNSVLKQQLSPVKSCLEPLPEYDLLQHVDSLVHLRSDQLEVEDVSGTMSESGNHSGSNAGSSCPYKADPLTARKKLTLWLTKTSTQNSNKGLSGSSLKHFVHPVGNPYEKSEKGSNLKLSKFLSMKKLLLNRNISSSSLVDQFISNPRKTECHTNLKKCSTVLAITPDAENRIGHNHQESRTKIYEKSSKTFQQMASRRSEIFSRGLKAQHTAPGGLISMQSMAEGLQYFPGLCPVNRLRSTSSNLQCSRCTSRISVSSIRESSQLSLLMDKRKGPMFGLEDLECKICLSECSADEMVTLEECRCSFCKECLKQYVTLEIMAGLYNISCPDPACPSMGVLSQKQMEALTDKELVDKHRSFRLNTEVSLDTLRTWCPSSGCGTICNICEGSKYQGMAVTCATCDNQFCSSCSATWHEGLSCEEQAGYHAGLWGDLDQSIKKCPQCQVPIERNEGCAQMMCRSCKHVFCWFCLASLDGDFLLRHYDSGSCQGKLGHSRSSVILHRAQVFGFFAVFGLLLLAASPLILIVAPAFICCKCRSCMKKVAKGQEKNLYEVAALKG